MHQKFRMRTTENWPYILFATAILVQISLQVGHQLRISDNFHYGEFVAAAMTIINRELPDGLPYTIHGAGDFLPKLLLHTLMADSDSIMSYTFLSYGFLGAAATGFAMLAAERLSRAFGGSLYFMLPMAALAATSIGWRDLFFLLSLYLWTMVMPGPAQVHRGNVVLQVALGAAAAFGAFWSFDRGVTTIVALGIPLLALAIARQSHLPAIVSFLLLYPLFGVLIPGMGIHHYLSNFVMLVETSDKWRSETIPAKTAAMMLAVNGMALFLACRGMILRRFTFDQLLPLIALVIATVFYLRTGLNRVDPQHVPMALWCPLLMLPLVLMGGTKADLRYPAIVSLGVIVIAFLIEKFGPVSVRFGRLPADLIFAFVIAATLASTQFVRQIWHPVLLQATVAFSCIMIGTTAASVVENARAGSYDWIAAITDMPADTEVVSDGVRWTVDQLKAAGADCVFDMVNNGTINGLSKLPTCSQFTYTIYAGPQHEDDLIKDVVEKAPTTVVYSGDEWSYRLDGMTMAERYPLLDKEIRDRYPKENCAFGYCVRSK